MVSEPEDYADFRILAARCPSGSKKNSMSFDSTNGMTRYRFTLGEVLSWNIDIDVIVGNGWTRITLREIPRFLVDALDFITANGLQIDGIFRKEGNSARLNRQEVLEVYRGVRQIPSDFTVLDVCTMVKRFLKDLKPTLLNSEEVRLNIIRKAKKARLSGEFELSHLEMVEIFESAGRHLSPSHLGTLGYVMRLLSRIAKHSETHKMTADNLAVVLVGSVFGDFMAGGGTESRKKMQQARKCTEAELHAKKEDMGIQVAAVKLLIVNANLIGLPHGHYVSSNRLHLNSHMNIRSTSAMPNIRCSSLSENEQSAPTSSATTPRVFSMGKASLMHQNHPASTGSSQIPPRTTLTRRDSDLTHVKGVNKPSSSTGTKRSSSFLPIPSLRGLRDRVSNQFLKRNKSPSPDKLRRQAFQKVATTSSSNLPPPRPPSPSHSTPVAVRRRVASGVDSDDDRREANRSIQKQGSTSSGRKSRTHTKKGNINSSAMKNNFDSDSQKSFQMSPNPLEKRTSISSSSSTLTNRSLRRISQSDQNSFQRGDATPPKKKKSGTNGGLTRRNTGDGLRKDFHNHRNVTRRSTFWGVDTIAEEKENRRSVLMGVDDLKSEEEDPKEMISVMEDTIGPTGESVLEIMNSQARQRRIGVAERRHRRLAVTSSGPSESMMVLNGSIATFDKLPPTPKVEIASPITVSPIMKQQSPSKSQQEYPLICETPTRKKEDRKVRSIMSAAKSKIGQQLEREMKQRLDVVATPMLSRRTASESVAHRNYPQETPLSAIPLRKLDSIGIQQHGHVWVGKTQTVVSSPIQTQRSQVEKAIEAEKVSPILARSPLFRSPSTAPPARPEGKLSPFFGFRSRSHLTEDQLDQEYAGLATPPRDRRLLSSSRPPPARSNLIYSSPTMKQQQASTEHLTQNQPSPSLTRSSSLMIGSPRPTVMSPLVPADDDSQNFKCPFLPPMRSHETQKEPPKEQKYSHQSTPIPVRKTSRTQISTDPNSSMEFGDFNEIIKNSTEDTNFPIPHQPVEARPSVTALRSSACGLVQSRINHFQTIERSISHRRTSADLSTSGGRPSTTSLKSIDTTNSSSGKL
ncbi:hypothetical protein L3Y34_003477 [Caenorhabditis briggsae]|uniref:Rho-GAP domain-containing protein n=1 Tax=Caenorhabditis briggsae TaxID=6238 RepID=A0AAE9AFL7_CAEBR|nr:hypothetical protein L3Y34_003477 [Caenorhabditis briggsae]